ncbi:Hypothetical protein NTJ_15838 [Nesidiocoris tenuis]|uniref:Uncharacterized protein n=1 Tax=Nesidiocoris tenuis TaxID=355587 RepID=A0ABN7BGZ3_9HEMI|nr:Hypothetical protein NTJ_15838 [Nesidiocoris tenuis]
MRNEERKLTTKRISDARLSADRISENSTLTNRRHSLSRGDILKQTAAILNRVVRCDNLKIAAVSGKQLRDSVAGL